MSSCVGDASVEAALDAALDALPSDDDAPPSPPRALHVSTASQSPPCWRRDAPRLSSLPPEVLLRVLRSLSALDLVHLSSVGCASLRAASAEPSHWARLFRCRWPGDAEGGLRGGWRTLYADRDAAELDDTNNGDGDALFAERVRAKRAEPPPVVRVGAGSDTDVAASAAAAQRGADAGESVALRAWRAARPWLSPPFACARGRATGAACTPACGFDFLACPASLVAVCRSSGAAHVCSEDCSESHTHARSGEVTTVCSLTGRVRSHNYDEEAEDDARGGGDGDGTGDGEAADECEACGGCGGVYGAAYAAGYECTSEAELLDAQWGVVGIRRPAKAAAVACRAQAARRGGGGGGGAGVAAAARAGGQAHAARRRFL